MGRHYKLPRLDPNSKEGRIAKEKETRDRNKARLTQTEKILCEGIRQYGRDLLQATARGETVDEALYTMRISSEITGGKYE